MLRYVIRRILLSIVTLFGITVIVFFFSRVSGDPIRLLFPEGGFTPEQLDALREEYGLNEPIIVQYWVFISNAVQGDFGRSISSGRPALEEVLSRAPATIELAMWAMLVTLVIGIPLGIAAGTKPGGVVDRFVKPFAIIGNAAPAYWVGLLAIFLFAGILGILPATGRGTWQHLIMPAAVQAWFSLAVIVRISRSSVLHAMNEDYVRTARAKGLHERQVINIHALKNASLPIITMAGLDFAAKLGGVAITETIFAWPGVGRLAVTATYQRDYPVIQAAVLFAAFMFIVINFAVDLLYTWLDPRVRLS
jgi:peptide/nickel transport system permease protein